MCLLSSVSASRKHSSAFPRSTGRPLSCDCSITCVPLIHSVSFQCTGCSLSLQRGDAQTLRFNCSMCKIVGDGEFSKWRTRGKKSPRPYLELRQGGDVVSSNLNEVLEFLNCSFHRVVKVGTFGAPGDEILHFELGIWRWLPHRLHRGAGFDGHINGRSCLLPSIRHRLRGFIFGSWWCAFDRTWWRSTIIFHWRSLASRSRIARAKNCPSCVIEFSQRTCKRKARSAFLVEKRHHVQVERGSVAFEERI